MTEDPGSRAASSPSIDRSKARDWAVQLLYAWEAGDRRESREETLDRTMGLRRIAPGRLPYIRRILRVLDQRGEEVDARIQEQLENWRLERLAALDRAVLRLAAAEILFLSDIPPLVSIQEAIHLAERYGGSESARFVNGVLDALYRSGETSADRGVADRS